MTDDLSISTVIGNIYEASYNPDFWPMALEGIAEFTHSSSAALLYQDSELKNASSTHVFNIPKDHQEQYAKIKGGDPNFKILAERIPLGTAAAADHLIPDRKILEQHCSKEWLEFITSTGSYYYTSGAILFMDEIRSSGIGLQRKKKLGLWNKYHIDKLNLLIPHLQRALNIQKEFTRLQTREQALRKGLDKLLMALVLFDKELQPIYVNPVAESILDYHPAIEMKNNKIYANDYSDTVKIHKALITAISSNNEANATESSTALGLKYPDCTTTLPLIISPVQDVLHGFETHGSFAHAVMCFSDPNRSHPIEADKLATVYQLTAAEAQVSISIANGMSPDEIANTNDVAISTIRSQLKSIYHKLGINHQTELVKILLTGPFGSTHKY